MKRMKFVVSLITKDNDYQMEQAAAAEETARSLGVDLQIMYADNDAITQSQQLLEVIQVDPQLHPSGIILEAAGGTALPQVARAAAKAGIAWAVLNRSVGYISELRKVYRTPLFCVSCDNQAAGRIQGKQFVSLLPNGGSALYIQGPSDSAVAAQRTEGMHETRGAVEVKLLRAHWTEDSSYKAINSWLQLSTSRQNHLDLVAPQNDAMAMGARRAFKGVPDCPDGQRWLELPFLGMDGVKKTGLAWVKQELLHATIIVPPNASKALEMMTHSLQTGTTPPEMTTMAPVGFPPVEHLRPLQTPKKASRHSTPMART
jgi:ribose transport system substrate-binding protein